MNFLTILALVSFLSCKKSSGVYSDSIVHNQPDTVFQNQIISEVDSCSGHPFETWKQEDLAPDSAMILFSIVPAFEDSSENVRWQQMKRSYARKYDLIRHYTRLYNGLLPMDSSFAFEFENLKRIPNRAFLLWVRKPRIDISPPDDFSCLSYTDGFIRVAGSVYVSLVDVKKFKIINTVSIESSDRRGDLPLTGLIRDFACHPMSGKYFSDSKSRDEEGMVNILKLEDHNGDHFPHEFGFFENIGCCQTETTLYGYSRKKDRVIHYPIDCISMYNTDSTFTKDTTGRFTDFWATALFTLKPGKKERKFMINFIGRAGTVERYHSTYLPHKERFVLKLDARMKPGDDSLPFSWVPTVLEYL